MGAFKYFIAFLVFVSLALCLAYYVRFWPLELLVSFAPLVTCLLLLSLTACGFFILFKHPLLDSWAVAGLILAGALCVFSFWKSLNALPLAHKAGGSKNHVTFVTFNKEFSNHDYKGIANYLKAQKADVVALQEATPEAVKQISQMADMKHYYISSKLNTVKGTGAVIISRYSLRNTRTLDVGAHSSLVRAEISAKKELLAFYSLHLVGPFSPNRYGNRGHYIKSAAQYLDSEKMPAVLGGDFNTTPYSPDLRAFNNIVDDKFKNTAVQQWPECTRYNLSPLLCLRIDHVYIPVDASLVDIYKSPDLGSDHRALTVKLSL